jgi:NAD+ synthase
MEWNVSEERTRIVDFIRTQIDALGFQGALVGISGGIDSAVVGALLVEALGNNRGFGLLLPERDSAKSTIPDSRLVCRHLGIPYRIQNIAPLIRILGVYRTRPPARIFPQKVREAYARAQWQRSANPYIDDLKNAGDTRSRINQAYYRSKHRMRMVVLYFEAEKRGYAVIGTTNKTEYLTGFFVKWGDDSSDIDPILHLYKTQVFALARLLDVPPQILNKAPSPDLAPGITDEYAIGIHYSDLDRILEKIEQHQSLISEDPLFVRKVEEILAAARIRAMRNLSLV